MLVIRTCACAAVGLLILASAGWAGDTQISYTLTELGVGKWQYNYEVRNINLAESVKEFTIYFDYTSTTNLTITTAEPLASDWDELIWQPEPLISDDGGYDAQALSMGIGMTESVAGFSVSFDWFGEGLLGSQFYEIIDPLDFTTIDSGYTIPEPLTITLLSFGTLTFLSRKSKK